MEAPIANPKFPNWLQRLTVGRNPRLTAVRIVIMVTGSFLLFRFMLVPIRIEGISMLPNYRSGQLNLVNRVAYLVHEPRRGDIVAIRLSPAVGLQNPSYMYLKRVIALPGETVLFQDGHAYVDGRLLNESYLKLPSDWNHEAIVCGPDQYFCVGDNRSMPYELHEKGRTHRDNIFGRILW